MAIIFHLMSFSRPSALRAAMMSRAGIPFGMFKQSPERRGIRSMR
jgi:hypothetical protein